MEHRHSFPSLIAIQPYHFTCIYDGDTLSTDGIQFKTAPRSACSDSFDLHRLWDVDEGAAGVLGMAVGSGIRGEKIPMVRRQYRLHRDLERELQGMGLLEEAPVKSGASGELGARRFT